MSGMFIVAGVDVDWRRSPQKAAVLRLLSDCKEHGMLDIAAATGNPFHSRMSPRMRESRHAATVKLLSRMRDDIGGILCTNQRHGTYRWFGGSIMELDTGAPATVAPPPDDEDAPVETVEAVDVGIDGAEDPPVGKAGARWGMYITDLREAVDHGTDLPATGYGFGAALMWAKRNDPDGWRDHYRLRGEPVPKKKRKVEEAPAEADDAPEEQEAPAEDQALAGIVAWLHTVPENLKPRVLAAAAVHHGIRGAFFLLHEPGKASP